MVKKLNIAEIALAILISFTCLYLVGCNPAKSHLAAFNCLFEAADFNDAAKYAQNKIKIRENPSGDDLLWTLQFAAAEKAQLRHSPSSAAFDKAEEMFNYYAPQSEVLDNIGATIVNDNVVPYKGEEYDKIMVNTYKALNFLAEGNLEYARVEFNRALDRQIRAREEFNAEIQKLEAQLEKQKDKNEYDANALADDPNVLASVNSYYPNLDQFEPYPDFVNPLATYLAALYLNLVGDYEKAAYLFKESYGMVPHNEYLAQDLLYNDDIIAGKAKPENMLWVIFENGLGPIREEVRIDIPLFLATSRVSYVGIALPRLQSRSRAYDFLSVRTGTGTYQTQLLADMERVIQTEFKKDFKGILTRAILSATIKATAQAAMQNQDNAGWAALAMAVYSYATTAADVRIWSALPKDFQIARCPIPQNRIVTIAAPDGTGFDVTIPSCKNAVVYVKIVHAGASPVTEVLAF